MSHVFKHPKYYKQLKEKYEKEASSIKQQAGDEIRILHEEWALKQGLRPSIKQQASSAKQQA
jgi:hypothetical protein